MADTPVPPGPRLDPRPSRELTSRELAKLLGGAVTALLASGLADPDELKTALQFILTHFDGYVDMIAAAENAGIADLAGPVAERHLRNLAQDGKGDE